MLNKEFDTWQDGYTEKIRRWVPYYDQLMETMTGFEKEFQAKDIMDLGCGNGNAVAMLLDKYPKAQFSMVDASAEMIEGVKERFRHKKEMNFIVEYFQQLELAPASFDCIMAGLSFHHLHSHEKQALFHKVFDWLRIGGIFSTADLFGSKKDADYDEKVIRPWKIYSTERGVDEGEWQTLMEHHQKYDFPDHHQDQINWLKAAGFKKVKLVFEKGTFGTIWAYKE